MKTVLQDEKVCWVCGNPLRLEEHHIFYGTANRKKSEQAGFKVWLCVEHHRGLTGVHFNRQLDLELKQLAQNYYENHMGNRAGFMQVFGKNYL